MAVREPFRTILEAAAVAAVGLVFAVVANRVSPRGLPLKADVTPVAPPRLTSEAPGAPTPSNTLPAAASVSPADHPPASPDAEPASPGAGIPELDDAAVAALHADPRREAELILFVDARGERAFEEGHIPGAWPYDPYRPGRFLGELLPLCSTAEVVVVYCNGGRCEDSHLAAQQLVEAGVPPERLRIYAGGITAWREAGRPLETGPHGSGLLAPPHPGQP